MANDLEIRIGAELTEIKGALASLKKDLAETGRTGNTSGRNASGGFVELERGIQRATNALAGFFTIYSGIQALRGVVNIADEYARLEAQLKLTTNSQDEFTTAQQETLRIAQLTRAPVAEVVNTYAALQRSTEGLQPSQEELVRVLETVNKSIALTPVSAETARASLTQFGQALAGNFQAGAQELNSILEQTPGLARAVADGLGVPVAALKRLGEQGQLSTELVFNGLLRISQQVDEQFSQVPLTVSGALTQLQNDVLVTLGQVDTSGLVNGIQELRDVLTDPAVQEGLLTLAEGLTTVAGAAASATAAVTNFVRDAAEGLAAMVNGPAADDIERVAERMQFLRNQIKLLEEQNTTGSPELAASIDARVAALRTELAAWEELYEAERQAQEQASQPQGETPEQKTARLREEAEARMEVARAAQEQAAEAKRLQQQEEQRQKQIDSTINSLQEQADTYGMSADEVIRYRLANQGASEAEIERAVQLSRTVQQLEAKAEAEKQAAEEAKKAAEEYEKLQQRVAEQLVDVQLRTLEATGRTVEATRIRLQLQFAELIRGLQQTGNEAGVQLVQNLIDTEVTRAQFDEIKRQFDQTVADLQARQQQLADQVTVGALTPAFADEQSRAARKEALQQLQQLTAQMQALAQASGDAGLVQAADAATAALQRLEIEGLTGLDAAIVNLRASWAQLQRQFAQATVDAGVNAVTQFFTDLASGTESAGDALRNFVRNFAASMAQIAARALATYAVLQLLSSITGIPPSVLAGAGSIGAGELHRGGMAGSGPRRMVNPLLFLGAPRYHGGGMVGLKQDEVPAILQTGEEVLSRGDPRNAANGGGSGYRIVNVVDPSMAAEYLESAAGERSILNVISRNAGSVRQTLG